MNAPTSRMVAFSVGTACFFVASALYILFRPTTLLMFHWIKALGLMDSVQLMRASVISLENLLPGWFIYSLPFGLWILAYLVFIEGIWANTQSQKRLLWLWCVPGIAISAEFLQINQIIPGSFDWEDLIIIISAIIIGFYISTANNLNKGRMGHG